MMKKYYQVITENNEANIYIYGDITSWEWFESDVSSYTLAKEIEGLDVDVINVYINSYGGEVSEGLAIYNSLKRHKAKVKTYCDGFACSAASVVFMAGDERIMCNTSLLMIHNVWVMAAGDANQLRKEAENLEKITEASKEAYLSVINIAKDELDKLMDEETWILPGEAIDMGFATAIVGEQTSSKAAASARKTLFNMVKDLRAALQTEPPTPEPPPEPPLEPPTLEPPTPEPGPEPDPPKENKPKKLMAALFR